MVDEIWLLSFYGSVAVALIAYSLNSWRERSFEKRKTKYHAKLNAFEHMTDALSRISINLAHLKAMASNPWPTKPSSQLEDSLTRMMVAIALAREEERAVEGSGLQKRLEEYNELMASPGGPDSIRLGEWVEGSLFTLVMLRTRLIDHYASTVGRAFSRADIILEWDEVEAALTEINSLIMKEFAGWLQQPAVPDLDEIMKGTTALEARLEGLRDAMYDELERTL